MRYSNSCIEKMGKVLFKSKNPYEVAKAEKIIEEWRAQHDIVLDAFEQRLLHLLQNENIFVIDRSRR